MSWLILCAGDAVCIFWFDLRVIVDWSLVMSGLKIGDGGLIHVKRLLRSSD